MYQKLLQLIFKHGYAAFAQESKAACLHQNLLLKELIHLAKNTEFGKKYHFHQITDYTSFQKHVPIHTYEDLEADILKMKAGAKNILWPGKIAMFAKSSGTSNAKSKYIPLSKVSLQENHFKGGKNILHIYSYKFPDKNIFTAKNLSVSGSFEEDKSMQIGDLSAILVKNLPPWVQLKRLPSKRLALLSNWEEKIEKISNEIQEEDIASLSGVPSWNLILLQKTLQKSGKNKLQEIWPNFQLFMHGGVNFTPYKKSFRDIIGSQDFVFMETYNASEGFFAIQDNFDEEENGMLLLTNHAVFYEFLPLNDLNNKAAIPLQLNEVELGVNYALIITTKSGLWRYMIGDTIQFTSLNPFRIKITGRTKYFINIFGEELIEDNVNRALDTVCEKLDCVVAEYTVGPIFPNAKGQGAHEWIIEFIKKPEDMLFFTQLLDEELQRVNSDYEAKRTGDLALQFPCVHAVEKGTFYQWLKQKNKLGGQHKVPRLQNHRKVIDEILSSF